MAERGRFRKEPDQNPPCEPLVCKYNGEVTTVEVRKPRIITQTMVKTAGFTGIVLAASAALGYAAESHTNEIARGKVETAQTCLALEPHEDTISKQLDKCMEKGVPGGSPIGADKFDPGEPIVFVETYINMQQREAAHIELGRVAAWTVGTPFVAAGYAAFFA